MATTPKQKKSPTFILVTQTLGIIVSSALLTWIWTWTGRSFTEALRLGVLFAIGTYAVNWLVLRMRAKRD